MSTLMSAIDVEILFVALLFVLMLAWFHRRTYQNLPPGPFWHLPVLGNLMEFTKHTDPRITLRKLRKRYGEIYSLYMGTQLVVVVNGLDAVRELLGKRGDQFSDRPNTFAFQCRTKGHGSRKCVGEQLARMELFLFITSLVQKFKFLPPSKEQLDIKELDGVFGITHDPKPFDIKLLQRY